MKIFSTLVLSSSLFLFAGCDAIGGLNPMGGGGGGGGQAMVDSMKDQPAMNMVALAPGAAVGTWWEHSMAGGAVKQKYSVVAEKDGKFIVESPMDMGGTMVIQAFLVDPTVDTMATVEPGQKMNTNVSMAWVGLEGEEPVERKVMDAMTMPEATGDAPEIAMTEGTETVNLGGKDWNSKWTETEYGKNWMADGSMFILRSCGADGAETMVLSGWGDDAEPMMGWK